LKNTRFNSLSHSPEVYRERERERERERDLGSPPTCQHFDSEFITLNPYFY
jgi:hypothetical protein